MINNREKNNIAKEIYEDLIVKPKEEIIDICTSQTLVIYKLEKENKELKNRIGRAIYFFEKKKAEQGDIYRNCESYKTNCIDFILTDDEIKFLNILKESDKE